MGTTTRRRQQARGAPDGADRPPAGGRGGTPEGAEGAPRGPSVERFEVAGEIGRGGMGVVYRAHDLWLGRDVALKVLPPHLYADAEARARLLAEARAAGTLDHPNICPIYEAGETADGGLYLAMPCYDGETLAARIARGPMPVAEAAAVAAQLARGLAAAHRRGIVHRDLKPSNVLLVADEAGGPPVAKILDFGIAKAAGGVALTKTGMSVGTLGYSAPEQARGEADARADLWSLGVVLYEMLAGRRPFEAPYEAALLYAVLHEPPPPLRGRRAEVPPALAAVVERLLAKDPAARYASADAVTAALGGQEVPGAASAPARRLGARGVQAAVVLVAIVLLAVVFVVQIRGALPDEKHIAVLPFTAPGADAADRAFADGLAETLSTELSGFERVQEALWVVPFSEVRAREVASAGEAHRELGATLVVTGSVQRAGDVIRVLLALVDAASLRQLRAQTLEIQGAELADLPALSVRAMEAMLEVELADEVRGQVAASGTTVPGAYEYYLQGLGYLQNFDDRDNLGHAVALFRRALEADPGFALAHARLGFAYWRTFERTSDSTWVPRAEAEVERAIMLAPEEPAAHVALATIRANTGHPDEAIRAAQRALRLDPRNNEAHSALAEAYTLKGEVTRAEAAYREAIRQRPGYWGGYYDLGAFYANQGRYDEAVAQFQEVLRLTPDNAYALLTLGGVYYLLGRTDEARRVVERSATLRPRYSTYSYLGTILWREERYVEAAHALERALAIDSTSAHTWGNLAAIYNAEPTLRARAPAAFRQAIRRAEARLRVTPNDAGLLADLAVYRGAVGEHAGARTAIERALDLNRTDVNVAYAAAMVYLDIGDRDSAIRWLREALDRGYDRSLVETGDRLAPLLADPRLRPEEP